LVRQVLVAILLLEQTAAILFLPVLLRLAEVGVPVTLLIMRQLVVLVEVGILLTPIPLRIRAELVLHSRAMQVVTGQTAHHQTNNR
jgi:hypothetical protein